MLTNLIACLLNIVDISVSHFLCLYVVFVLIWLTCLVSVIGISPVSFWFLSNCVVIITCIHE